MARYRGRHRAPSNTGRVIARTALASAVAAAAGYLLLDGAPDGLVASITAVAAGAILAMVVDTMIPEAYEQADLLSGLVTALGFLTAFAIHDAGG